MLKKYFKTTVGFSRFAFMYRKQWFFVIALSIATSVLGVIFPYLSKIMIDDGIYAKNVKFFIITILIAGGVFFLDKIFSGSKEFLERRIKSNVAFSLSKEVLGYIQMLPLSWFRAGTSGENLYKIDYDINMIAELIVSGIPQIIFIFSRLLLIIFVIIKLDYTMAIFTFCIIPFLSIPPYYFAQKTSRLYEGLVNKAEDIFKYLDEVFLRMQLIKTFGKEGLAISKYLNMFSGYVKMRMKSAKVEIFSSFVSNFIVKFLVGIIILYGGIRVINGRMSFGVLTAIMVYLYQLSEMGDQLNLFTQTFVGGAVSCKRISGILGEPVEDGQSAAGSDVFIKEGRIVFDSVSFGYNPGKYVLKNLSFTIEPGSRIAIVGYSGCGKTTLLNLLARLYEPQSGKILIDSSDIKGFSLVCLRLQLGFSLQEPFLWNDTIENNIRYGKDDATKEEVVFAAHAAGINEFVDNIPEGYSLAIGEDACRISEGQKQRIAIARAIIRRPKILILDEAMSSMDSASEKKIILNLKNYYKNMTIVLVSHRLSAVMEADLVYFFLDSGRMIVDSPVNLLKNNQEFIELFAGQDKISV